MFRKHRELRKSGLCFPRSRHQECSKHPSANSKATPVQGRTRDPVSGEGGGQPKKSLTSMAMLDCRQSNTTPLVSTSFFSSYFHYQFNLRWKQILSWLDKLSVVPRIWRKSWWEGVGGFPSIGTILRPSETVSKTMSIERGRHQATSKRSRVSS